MESAYWEDSPLRGPATDHWHVSNAAPDHKCAQCRMLHRKPKVPHRTTCVCGKEIFLDYSQTQEIVPSWRHSESKLIMCRGEGSVAMPATEAGSITSEPAPHATKSLRPLADSLKAIAESVAFMIIMRRDARDMTPNNAALEIESAFKVLISAYAPQLLEGSPGAAPAESSPQAAADEPKCVHCHMPLSVCQSEKWETAVVNRTRINWRFDEQSKAFVGEFPRKLTQAQTKERMIGALQSIIRMHSHLFLTGEFPPELAAASPLRETPRPGNALVLDSSLDPFHHAAKLAESERKFKEHTEHVKQFLNDMYATMIDPCAEGEIKVAETCAALLNAAREQREYIDKAERRFRTACLWVWKGLDAPGQTLESTMEAMIAEAEKVSGAAASLASPSQPEPGK
jgi:hypothetical protein